MNKATGTQTTIANSASKGLIVHNRSAGDGEADKLQAQLRGQLGAERFDLLELDDEMPLCKVLGSSVQKHDYKWIAAAGGDGTVSKVGGCLVNLDLPLAIIPAGTGNAIAGALGIPEDVEQACRLLQGGVSTRTLDAIQVGQQFFFLQVGVGLEALTMQETTSEQKNRLGELAYLWTAAKKAIKWQPHRFRLIIDGSGQTVEASELVLANIADVGLLGMRWGDQIAPDDGVLDVVAINVKKASEYVEVVTALARGTQANSSLFTYLSAHDRIRIETEHPLPIHGDGGEVEMSWPLEASLVPGALTVIVPSPDTA